MTEHPVAPVPDRLFDDEREQRWRARFTAPRMSRPGWARDAPDRCVYTSNASGTTEVYAWDRATDQHRQVTDRRSGTHSATLPPDGATIWWFADTDGDEFGHWVREPFAGRPADAAAGAGPARRRGRLPGRAGDRARRGRRRHLDRRRHHDLAAPRRRPGARSSTSTPRTPGSARCPRTRRCWRSATPSTATPGTRRCGWCGWPTAALVAEKSDGPGKGLTPLAFAPVRRGQPAAAAARAPRPRGAADLGRARPAPSGSSPSTCPASCTPTSTPTARHLLVWHTHAARTRLHRYDLDDRRADRAAGGAGLRRVGARCARTARSSTPARRPREPSTVRALHPDGTDRVLRRPARASARRARCRSRTCGWTGPGGRVHALVARPPGAAGPLPAVFSLHGGPHAADEDRFSAVRAAWVDAGFVGRRGQLPRLDRATARRGGTPSRAGRG